MSENTLEDEIKSPYCSKCGSCGETGCCPPIHCETVVCKYGEINLKDYKCFQDQWEVMFNALQKIMSCTCYCIDSLDLCIYSAELNTQFLNHSMAPLGPNR